MLLVGLVGSTSQNSRWTILVLDLQYILSVYLNRQYTYIKNIRLCANMFVRGVFTSDIDYQPGLSVSEARRLGLLDKGVSPLPREMAFPLPKGADWDVMYDYIKFPPDSKVAQFGIMVNMKKRLNSMKQGDLHTKPLTKKSDSKAEQNSIKQVDGERQIREKAPLCDKRSSSKVRQYLFQNTVSLEIMSL